MTFTRSVFLFPSVPPGSCPELAALWSVEFNNRKEEARCEMSLLIVVLCAYVQIRRKDIPLWGVI